DLGDLIADYLDVLGHSPTTWRSARQARPSLPDMDIVITDVSLDGESGVDLCRDIGRLVPVIVVSGDPDNKAAALDAGAVIFLLKPVDVVSLGDLVESLALAG
ncbi:MAG: DNA-binding response OmpR family regulator, partial [Myxococcota bacterium]